MDAFGDESRRILRVVGMPIAAVVIAAVLLAAVGAVCDLSGESLSVLVLVEQATQRLADGLTVNQLSGFVHVERIATLLTAGAANGLYTIGGLLLMIKTTDLPRYVRWAMVGTWTMGAGMTFAAILNHVDGMAMTTAVLFPLFIAWTVWLGALWRHM